MSWNLVWNIQLCCHKHDLDMSILKTSSVFHANNCWNISCWFWKSAHVHVIWPWHETNGWNVGMIHMKCTIITYSWFAEMSTFHSGDCAAHWPATKVRLIIDLFTTLYVFRCLIFTVGPAEKLKSEVQQHWHPRPAAESFSFQTV